MRKQVELEGRVVDSPEVTVAMTGILARLRPALGQVPFEPEVLVIDSPVANAAALPGAMIVVYTGLMRAMRTPEQMAAVLAHELVHVAHRDSFNLIARQLGASALAAIVTGGGGGGIAQAAVEIAVNARYGREAEDRADAEGLRLLARAGVDPKAFAEALQRLKELAERKPELLRWLDPHSAIDERIVRARRSSADFKGERRPIEVKWDKALAALPSIFD